MPKLIVQDGDQKRAFRLSKGRLTLGSADSNKLVLTSAGVQPEHAVLTIREEAATLDALAPVEIDGERATGDGLAVPIGAVIRIGGAAIALRPDEAAAKATPAKTGTAARGSSRGGSSRGGGSSRAGGSKRSGGSRSGASRGSARAGARSRRGGGDDEEDGRPGRRGAARSGGRPAWLMPLVVGFALVIVVIGIAMASGSGNETMLNQAMASVNGAEWDRARSSIDEVQRSALSPDRYSDYDETLAAIEIQEQQAEVDSPRSNASKWADQFLIRFIDSYLAEETRAKEAENGRENYTRAKMRTWLDRYDEFEREWPDWDSAAWRHRPNWDEKADQLIAIREDLSAQMSQGAPMTDMDVEWALFYYTDPGARKGNRFDKAKDVLAEYRTDGGNESVIADAETLIAERANAYAEYFFDLAQKTFKIAQEQNEGRNSDSINRQHLTAVNHLLLVARYSGLPERANQALDFLEGFPRRVDIMKSYVREAQRGDASAAEKVAYLEAARPTFRAAIDKAREELDESSSASDQG